MIKENVWLLAVSDLHLPSQDCNGDTLLQVFQDNPHEKLLINGDLFWWDGELRPDQLRLIEYLRKNKDKLMCIEGNHDRKRDGLVKKRLGVRVFKQYSWTLPDGRKCFAIHGHQFDWAHLLFENPFVDRIFMFIVWLLKMMHIKGYGFKSWVEGLHNHLSEKVAKGAIRYAKKHTAKRVCGFRKRHEPVNAVILCGHTHVPTQSTSLFKDGSKIEYFNIGDWMENCSFITIGYDGAIKLRFLRDE